MDDKIKNGFTAELCNFQGVQGYMVKQWNDSNCICSQFIAAESYNDFCKAAGINPVKIKH